jgi:hypothetical protein
METRERAGWMTVLIVAAVIVGIVFVLWFLLPLVGIFGGETGTT